MPAKELAEWAVTAGATTEDAAKEILDHLGGKAFGVISKKTSHVCSHCGRPWPMRRGRPATMAEYSREVFKNPYHSCVETKPMFCCEATQLDCEGTNESR